MSVMFFGHVYSFETRNCTWHGGIRLWCSSQLCLKLAVETKSVGMRRSKVRDAGVDTMNGGGFAAEGDLTLGGSFWSDGHDPDNPTAPGAIY